MARSWNARFSSLLMSSVLSSGTASGMKRPDYVRGAHHMFVRDLTSVLSEPFQNDFLEAQSVGASSVELSGSEYVLWNDC